jgi:hypothetical protein
LFQAQLPPKSKGASQSNPSQRKRKEKHPSSPNLIHLSTTSKLRTGVQYGALPYPYPLPLDLQPPRPAHPSPTFHDRNSQPNMMNQAFTERIYQSIVRSFSLSFFPLSCSFLSKEEDGKMRPSHRCLRLQLKKREGKKNIGWHLRPSSLMPSRAEHSYSCLGDDAGEGEGGWCLSAWAESNGGRRGT